MNTLSAKRRQCFSEERSSELILHLLMRMCMKALLRKINNFSNVKEVFQEEFLVMSQQE